MIWTLLGLYLVLVVLLHVSPVQRMLGSCVADAVGTKLGTRVEVGRVDLGMFNRLIIDDVLIYDQQKKEMLRIARMSAKLDIASIAHGRVSVSSAQLFGARISLYKTTADAKPNYQFALDSLASKDTTKKSALDLRINSFIMRHGSLSYDRYDVAPVYGRFSTAHINVSDISANVQLKVLRNDSVNLNIRRLSMRERSGLKLNRLSLKMEGGRSGAKLHELNLKLNNSQIDIPKVTATYTMLKDNKPDMTTLRYNGEIERSKVVLSDMASLVPALKKFTMPLRLTAKFSGTSNELLVSTVNIVSDHSDIMLDASGWLRKREHSPLQWKANLRSLTLTEQAVAVLYDTFTVQDKELPAIVGRLGRITASGNATSTATKRLDTSFKLATDVGNVDADMSIGYNGRFSGTVSATDVQLNRLTDNDKFGKLSANIAFDGNRGKNGKPTVNAKGEVSHFEYAGYQYRNVRLDGAYADGGISGKVNINDAYVSLDAEGAFKKGAKASDIKLKANVRRIIPSAIGLTKKWGNAVFSANIDANINGTGMGDATGFVGITNFAMTSANADYKLNNLSLRSGKDDNKQFLMLNSDFGHAEIVGQFNLATVGTSLTNFVRSKLPTLPGLPNKKTAANNDLLVSAVVYNTDWASKLLNIPLIIERPVTLNGKIDDRDNEIYINCTAPDFTFDGSRYSHASVAVTSPSDFLHCDVHLTKLMDNGDKLNLSLTGRANDNKMSTSFSWNGNGRKSITGQLNADAQLFSYAGQKEARVDIRQSYIDIDGTQWQVSPSSVIYTDRLVIVDNFSVHHGEQHIMIDGTASKSNADSLTIDLNGVNVGYILNLINFHTVEFDGQASGRAYIKTPFSGLSADGKFKIRQFTFEDGNLGTFDTSVKWNSTEKQIDISGVASDGPKHRLNIDGYISPSRKHIDLSMHADGTRLEFMRSFTSSFSKDIDGAAYGYLRLAGPMSNINLTGMLIVDGEATINPLGCRYRLEGDTIRFVPDDIQMNNALIYDMYGNKGWLTGGIHHRHLTKMSYDLDVRADNLLVYDYKDFGDDTFYGTVYGTGRVGIHGRSGELTMDIDITPERNTTFVYNVSNPDAISSQEFIHWNDATPTNTVLSVPKTEQRPRVAERLPGTDVRLNFTLDVTPDATMKLLMDSKTNDYITLNGHGAIRASYYNRGSFNMYGTYTVDRGTYGITIQDILKKNFTFNDGGTIVFGGNPFDASLDLQAVYTVNGVSLSDLNIGNSFSNNTIRVNCLMNIGGQARQPQIDFDIDMPTVSTDEKQMVRSVLNSEDEMNQQVLYLLGIGRFYPQGSNNATAQNERQQSQTSLAMQSLLSGTISSQINNLLGTVVNSNNWNFGANISTGDEGWNNAEYEGLLSGRLLNNRLLFNGQFGYRSNVNTANTSFIGDFDIRYLLFPNGNLALKMYNQTNDRYFTKSSLNTQGIGLIMKKDFSNLGDLFGRKKKKK